MTFTRLTCKSAGDTEVRKKILSNFVGIQMGMNMIGQKHVQIKKRYREWIYKEIDGTSL